VEDATGLFFVGGIDLFALETGQCLENAKSEVGIDDEG
jgi:hypothetical protein